MRFRCLRSFVEASGSPAPTFPRLFDRLDQLGQLGQLGGSCRPYVQVHLVFLAFTFAFPHNLNFYSALEPFALCYTKGVPLNNKGELILSD